jgi:uncharacterized protein involved in outer membrane biogenesis
LELGGSLNAAILPYPHVKVDNIIIDSANTKGPYAFIGSVENASISIALLPLLSGNITVSNISLIRPNIALKEQKQVSDANDLQPNQNVDQNTKQSESQAEKIKIQGLSLTEARIAYTPLDGDEMIIEIPQLTLSADTLKGPFDAQGSIVFQEKKYNFDAQTGVFGGKTPMSVNAIVNNDSYSVKYDGVLDTATDSMNAQGEISFSAKSLSDFGIELRDEVTASGLLTVNKTSAKLDNGFVQIGDSKANFNFVANGLGEGQSKDIATSITFTDDVNLDDILSELPQSEDIKQESNDNQTVLANSNSYNYLPETISLPSNLFVDAKITVPSLIYKNKAIKNVNVNAIVKNNVVNTQVLIGQLPDSGSLNIKAQLKGQSISKNGASGSTILSHPSLSLDGNVNIASVKMLASDWLKVVDASVFDNPSVPNTIKGPLNGSVKESKITIGSSQLQAGQYNMKGMALSYTNAKKSLLGLSVKNLDGARINVSGELGNTKQLNVDMSHANTVKAIQIVKPEFQSTAILEKPFAFKALVIMGDETIKIQNMDAKLGDVTTTGDVSIETTGSKPDIKSNLIFDRLDTQALMGGEKSTGKASGKSSNTVVSSNSVNTTPWTKQAIDTDWMRTMNIDIQAKANALVHGTWTINNPSLDIALNNGSLNIRNIQGGLFGGTVDMNGMAVAKQAGQPLDINSVIKASNVDLNKLVRSALNQNKDRVLGQGSFNITLNTKGLSSHALINNLNGDGRINTTDLTIIGIDLAKLSEAISDESLTDLAAMVRSSTNGGQTKFNPVEEEIIIRNGVMPINDFVLQNNTATLTSNGTVNFASWFMDLKNTIQIMEPEKLPELVINLKGPLNNPSKDVANDLIKSYLMNKYGAKINEKIDNLLGDKLKDSPVKGLINNFLGVPANEDTSQPVSNDNTSSNNAQEKETSPEEQVIKGLFNAFGK